MALRKQKKDLVVYEDISAVCDIVIGILESVADSIEQERAITIFRGSRVKQLLEIQSKTHRISAFGYKIGEIARTTRFRLEGY